MKKIGVLTSGDDAPGMNAAIRAVVRSGTYHGVEMVGIKHGSYGVIHQLFEKMDEASVGSIMQRGGTILQSSISEEIYTEEGLQRGIKNLKNENIEALIIIGGREALRTARAFDKYDLPCVVIPATIESNIPGVDYTIGFHTALNNIIHYIDRIRDTASSHEKTSIVEVAGESAGNIAYYAGLAGGAEKILIPGWKEDADHIVQQLKAGDGKRYSIIVIAEGIINGEDFKRQLKEQAGVESRLIVLGDTQRGGAPTGIDRILASQLGAFSIESLLNNRTSKMVGIYQNELVSYGLDEVPSNRANMEESMYQLFKKLS
ncbi:ATP-dependent 6-phosphofructokinase [Halobacillus halophilus]|uniref:ATP-dependent 6-phosphofructokinase n=1 Tax=Halobacillus halophilus TaxID=1570 RepID=UPI001CD1C4A7|nr:ATP-dependent 6-phosphofructokinase [Halobacillus halophilus]MCA1011507.1 ATP-dependent 6-phosphofructokinase [Halobacillus halophilus]